jgi:acetate kinase
MASAPRSILVLNAGSSSLKLALFDWDTEAQSGEQTLDWSHDVDADVRGHAAAVQHLLSTLDLRAVRAVGHRVVHGGALYRQAVRIDSGVEQGIADLAELAPLHNPAALEAIRAARAALPAIPQVAAFDTAFHATMPPEAYLYGVPYAWYEQWAVRRYGFHGLSHDYCAGRAAALLNRPLESLRLITCHLGNGCSLAAVAGGRSIATTMGFTPLEGVLMGSRSGSVDPGLLLYLITSGRFDAAGLDDALNHESGLKGVSGVSSDMREILKARAAGHARATLAFDLYTARIREAIGALTADLGGLDALVFTAGVGEHAAEVREAVAGRLGWLGVALDSAANAGAEPDVDIALPGSAVRALVIHTREDLVVARETRRVLEAA